MYQSPKSATTAGLLGIFLGSVGAHNWYLGDKKKGIIHISMIGAAILLEIIAFIVTPKDVVSLYSSALSGGGQFAAAGVLSALGGIVAGANALWGFIEGIIIISQGDAGLASKGYNVAAPAQGYGQPMNGYNQMPQQNYYGQPMPGQPPMGQPMPGQQSTGQQANNSESGENNGQQ